MTFLLQLVVGIAVTCGVLMALAALLGPVSGSWS